MNARMRDLPTDARPRERLWTLGPVALSPIELIALILGSGRPGESAVSLSAGLVDEFGGLAGLASAAPEELARHPGVGRAKAAALLAALRLAHCLESDERPARVRRMDEFAEIARKELAGRRREHVIAIVLDAGHRVRRVVQVSEGAVDGSLFPLREILNAVLRNDGKAFVVAHNHPSGDPTPSRDDIDATEELAAAARLLGLHFLDHFVVGDAEWTTVSRHAAHLR